MDFAGMKRRELQALCADHGLAARGSKADLAACLAGAISAATSAVSSEKVVEVIVGKGCLKRSGDGLSGSGSGAVSKKVTFSFDKNEEAGEALVAAKVSTRGLQEKHLENGLCGEGVAGEACADARVMLSRTDAVNLRAGNGVEKRDNLAEEEQEVVEAIVDTKRRIRDNPKSIAASSQAGVSRRSTRKSTSSTDVDTIVQGQNDPAKKEGEVMGGVGHTKLKVEETLPAAAVSGRGCRRMCTEECGSTSSVEGVTGPVGVNARETRSKRNAGNLCAGSRVESQKTLAEPEKDGKVVQKAVDNKRKQKTLQNPKKIAANGRSGIFLRSKRGSSLSADDDVLLCPVVEKKRGKMTAELDVNKKSAEVQDLPIAPSPLIIASEISQRKEEDFKLVSQESAKVAVSGRVTRSRSVNSAAVMPVVIENTSKMKTETVRVAPAVSRSDDPTNDAHVTRSLRNRALKNNNTMAMLEETHVGNKLEKKRQPRGSAIGRHHQFSSSVEEKPQAAAPCNSSPVHENAGVGNRPPVRRSTRNHVVASRT